MEQLNKYQWKPVGDSNPRPSHYATKSDYDWPPIKWTDRAKRFFKFVLFKRDLEMPQVHFVKSARKTNRALGIKKGDSYYWWKNRLPGQKAGTKRVSFSRPKPSQVCGNPFTSQVLAFAEQLEALVAEEGLADAIEAIASDIRQLADEQQEKYDNMPESLQSGPTGELLQEREEALNAWADELEAIEVDEDELEDALLEAQETAYQGS